MSGKKVSLAELMGGKASQGMHLSRLHEVLGEATPQLPRNAVGRHRLVRSLNQRFGPNWRSLPGTSDLIKQFDTEIDFEKKISSIKAIKYEPSKQKNKGK